MRQRATAVVIRNGKVLLVKDKGHPSFSLPGGKINSNEPTISAAAREPREELGLNVANIERRREADFKGSLSQHRVCLAEVDNEPRIRGHELDRYRWWDMREQVQIYEHVKPILVELRNFI